jgi:Skp family chaperone for outer membrane proteins
MRRPAFGLAALVMALAGASAAPAQVTAAPDQGALSQGTVQMPFVTLDEARLFSGSRYGQALLAELEAELARREKDLTERRPSLSAEDFRALANAFNTEVEDHRNAQKSKERAIYQRHDEARLRFRDVANQVLAQVMQERGALAIIAEEAIVLGFREIDITDAAIARVDDLVGDGSSLPRPEPGPPAQPASP